MKDVDRTYQENPFFKAPGTKRMMENIFLTWCRKSSYGYKQGMNEVLAAVLHVYHAEIDEGLGEPYCRFVSADDEEADVYSLFDAVMRTGHDRMFAYEADEKKTDINPNSKNQQPILQRIARMVDHEFKVLDIELFRHIKLQEVQLRPYLLRWIRCMHSRELPLAKALIFWDHIFLEFHQSG